MPTMLDDSIINSLVTEKIDISCITFIGLPEPGLFYDFARSITRSELPRILNFDHRKFFNNELDFFENGTVEEIYKNLILLDVKGWLVQGRKFNNRYHGFSSETFEKAVKAMIKNYLNPFEKPYSFKPCNMWSNEFIIGVKDYVDKASHYRIRERDLQLSTPERKKKGKKCKT